MLQCEIEESRIMPMRERLVLLMILALPACGGRTELEGLSPDSNAGGTMSTGGNQATGCTGNLETTQGDKSLCVAKMVTITGPVANSDYQIDATEVTKGQYDAWLATNPPLPASTDPTCGYVSSYAEKGMEGVYTGPDADHHPVVYVDWCDANSYCKGVGKRLCGAIGGGSIDQASGEDASTNQWYRACSSAGIYTYPYGNTYQGNYCDGGDYWNDDYSIWQTVTVGSLASCKTSATGFAGVYDLSGNVFEWEDSCYATSQSAACFIRGGSFMDGFSGPLSCGYAGLVGRGGVSEYYGFRCCSP